jgi:methylated-DNA-[protein]-cysteine S-methyltransferase
MKTAFIHSPLGSTKIEGDANGIAVISVLEEAEVSTEIPTELQEAVTQLQEYFEGKRTEFNFKKIIYLSL